MVVVGTPRPTTTRCLARAARARASRTSSFFVSPSRALATCAVCAWACGSARASRVTVGAFGTRASSDDVDDASAPSTSLTTRGDGVFAGRAARAPARRLTSANVAPRDASGYQDAAVGATSFELAHAMDAAGTVYYVVREGPLTSYMSATDVRAGVEPGVGVVADKGSSTTHGRRTRGRSGRRRWIAREDGVLRVVGGGERGGDADVTEHGADADVHDVGRDGSDRGPPFACPPWRRDFAHGAQDEDGTLYYVLQARNTAAPSVSQVISGLDVTGSPAMSSGSM